MKEWLLPTLGAVIFWGIWAFLPKISADSISPQSSLIYQLLGGIIVCFLFSFGHSFDIDPKGSMLAIVAGAANFLGLLCYLKAVSKGGEVSIVSTISALYPILVILLAFLLLQESLTWKQGIGVGFGLAAIALFAS